ncbi:vacuolar cation/proton exchanger 2 [Citrus sinensis]|nr:vacuolar cation/proton exchanger 2 [Citrus sinensis]
MNQPHCHRPAASAYQPMHTFCSALALLGAANEIQRVHNLSNDLVKFYEGKNENVSDAVVGESSSVDVRFNFNVNQGKYPILAQMAKDNLVVPMKIVASESASSTGGRVLTLHHSRLHPTTLEALMCTQHWLWANSEGKNLESEIFIGEEFVDEDESGQQVLDLDVSGGRNAYVTRSCNGVIESIKVVVFSTKLNILIIFGPAAIVVDKTSDANGWVFLLSLLGIIPLAERLGFATEIDDINLCIQKGHDVCSSTIITRFYFIKLVAGARLCFLLWGTCECKEGGSKCLAVASVNSGLLLMAVMALLFLAVLLATHTELHFEKSKLALSRFCSCAMLVAYAAYLYFQLKSQWQLCDQGASMELKMPVAFISIILLPIVGNAGAIMFTMKDKLVPFSIVIGRIMGRPIDLNLQLFETATLMITV